MMTFEPTDNQSLPSGELDQKSEDLAARLEERGVNVESIEAEKVRVFTPSFNELFDSNTEGKSSEEIQNIAEAQEQARGVMNELGIEPDSRIEIQEWRVSFREDVKEGKLLNKVQELVPQEEQDDYKVLESRPQEQSITFYVSIPKDLRADQEVSMTIFSHGGQIREEAAIKSPFPYIIQKHCQDIGSPTILVAMNHRGSGSREDMNNYCLDDRVTDLEVVNFVMRKKTQSLTSEKSIKWKDKTVLVGNSFGGYVVARASNEINPEKILLVQPAAYSPRANITPLGDSRFTKQIRDFKITNESGEDVFLTRNRLAWKASDAFGLFREYINNGGNALIIGSDIDLVIDKELTDRYVSEIAQFYATYGIETKDLEKLRYVAYLFLGSETNTTHTKTSRAEISHSSKFIAS